MVLGEIIFWVLIFLVGSFFTWLIGTERIELPSRYRIKIIVLNEGCNIHKDIKIKELPHEEKIKVGDEEKTFKVVLENLWKIKVIFYKRIYYFLTGVKGPYLNLFRASNSEAVILEESKATPGLIKNVKGSRILGKALKEVFTANMSGMGRFIIILGVTLLIIYLGYQYGVIG